MKPVGNLNNISVEKLDQCIRKVLLGIGANIPVDLDQSLLQDGLDLLGRQSVLQTVPEQNQIDDWLQYKNQTRIFTSIRTPRDLLQTKRNTALKKVSVPRILHYIVPLKKGKLFQMSP